MLFVYVGAGRQSWARPSRASTNGYASARRPPRRLCPSPGTSLRPAALVRYASRPSASFASFAHTFPTICAGSVRWLNGVIYPLPHNPTDRKLFCYILKDITQSKELEQRLRDNERKLRYAANVRLLFFDDVPRTG